ncbi:prohibitin family protein [Mucilaginibacter terrae]|uniref:prohibitin family protein n=1 Tax=Mucilaginibacter terrae TaxID=1955052 RepID=UPI0036437F0F
MVLIFLGIIILVVGSVLKRSDTAGSRFSGIATTAGIVLMVLGVFLSAFKTISPGQAGVQTLFGKVQNNVLESGLHVVNPLVDVTTFNIQTQNYTMSGVHSEGDVAGDDAIRVLCSDGLEVTIDLSVLFRVNEAKAPFIYQNIGIDYLDKLVRPVTRTVLRDNAVNYQAVDLYSTKRQQFQDRIFQTISSNFAKNGLELQQILVRNVSLPASVKASIESKINAEQEAQKMQFVLQKERQEAERKRVEAQGIADYQKILSTGLSDKQLQYESIQAQKAIATSANAKVIIMGNGKTPVILGNQ